MAYIINSKIRDMEPYQPILGTYRIRLDANESFLQPDPEIISKIKNVAASVPFNRYPDPYAEELCRAFAGFYGISAANVVAGNGSDELISLLFGAFLMKGESVMTLSPDFSMYRFYGGISEAKCVEFQKKDDFTVDVNDLIDAVNQSGVRMIIFSNPCNPTSLGMKREEIRHLVRSVDALVVLDEAYMDFWNQSMLGEVNDYDNLVILRTCSKAVGMAAVRLGFAVANQTLIRSLKAVKSPYNVNAVSQKIGTVLFNEQEWLRSCVREIIASRDLLSSALKDFGAAHPGKISVLDSAANFVTVRFSGSEKIYRILLEKGIAVRCFSGFLRVTAGNREENAEFVRAFSAALK